MDDKLRAWEREIGSGKTDLIPLYGDLRKKAGLFWVEEVEDQYLRQAWDISNLMVEGEKHNLRYGRGFVRQSIDSPRYSRDRARKSYVLPPQWEAAATGFNWSYTLLNPREHNWRNGKVMMTSTSLWGAIHAEFYAHKDNPAFKESVTTYAADWKENERGSINMGRCEYSSLWNVTLEQIALDYRLKQVTCEAQTSAATLLKTSPEVPEQAAPLLSTLFGANYLRVLDAAQHFTDSEGVRIQIYKRGKPDDELFEERNRYQSLWIGRLEGHAMANCLNISLCDVRAGLNSGGMCAPIIGWRKP